LKADLSSTSTVLDSYQASRHKFNYLVYCVYSLCMLLNRSCPQNCNSLSLSFKQNAKVLETNFLWQTVPGSVIHLPRKCVGRSQHDERTQTHCCQDTKSLSCPAGEWDFNYHTTQIQIEKSLWLLWENWKAWERSPGFSTGGHSAIHNWVDCFANHNFLFSANAFREWKIIHKIIFM
jgi:hypothetical protein